LDASWRRHEGRKQGMTRMRRGAHELVWRFAIGVAPAIASQSAPAQECCPLQLTPADIVCALERSALGAYEVSADLRRPRMFRSRFTLSAPAPAKAGSNRIVCVRRWTTSTCHSSVWDCSSTRRPHRLHRQRRFYSTSTRSRRSTPCGAPTPSRHHQRLLHGASVQRTERVLRHLLIHLEPRAGHRDAQ